MTKSHRVQDNRAYWRKVCIALPAVALIGGALAFTTHAEQTRDIKGVAVSKGSPAIVVPDVALAIPPNAANPAPPSNLPPSPLNPASSVSPARPANPVVPVRASGDPIAVPEPVKPALVLPVGTVPGSSTPVTLDSTGIPSRALEGYRQAASLINAADPGCNIDWALLAAIGRVESDHARFGGNELDNAGVAQPGIIGIPLDGSNGTARITDSDGGQLDRDSIFDRAVGPMQFIPSTWRTAGTDADGDGVKNPQDMADASAASAIYLCSGPGDLSQPGDLHAAIMRYNASESYVRTVTSIASAYRQGVSALPASDLPASDRSASDRPVSNSSAASTSAAATPAQPIKASGISTARKPAPIPGTRPALPTPATSVTAKPTPVKSIPVQSTPATPKQTPTQTTTQPTTSTPTQTTTQPTTSTPTPTQTTTTPTPPPAQTPEPTPPPAPKPTLPPAQTPEPTLPPAQTPKPTPTPEPTPTQTMPTATETPTLCVPDPALPDLCKAPITPVMTPTSGGPGTG